MDSTTNSESSASNEAANTLARHGIRVAATMTKPSRPGKKPSPVWHVTGNLAGYEDALRELGGKPWKGAWSFWEDPTETLGAYVAENPRLSFAAQQERERERAAERAARREGYAQNARARSDAGYERARSIADMIPPGQPILVGHHSERRHRRDLARIDAGMRQSVEEGKKAEYHEGRARAARREADGDHDLGFIQRRLSDAEKLVRKLEQMLSGPILTDSGRAYLIGQGRDPDAYATDRRAFLEERLAQEREKVAYWKEEMARKGGVAFSKENVAKGDLVFDGHWALVLRVNPKGVTLWYLDPLFRHYEPKRTYAEIQRHVKAADFNEEQRAVVASILAERERKARPRRKAGGTGVFADEMGASVEAEASPEGGLVLEAKRAGRRVPIHLPLREAGVYVGALSKELGLFGVAQPQGRHVVSLSESSACFERKGASVELVLAHEGESVSVGLSVEHAGTFARRARDLIVDQQIEREQRERDARHAGVV